MTDRSPVAAVRRLVADLRSRDKLTLEGEALAATAVNLAKRLVAEDLAAGAMASVARELRAVIGELTAFDDEPLTPTPEAAGGSDDDEDDEWSGLVARLQTPVGDTPDS